MIKVAVLDDYQNIFKEIIDVNSFKNNIDFHVFNHPFNNEQETIDSLKDFEALFIMRERTPMTKSLLNHLDKLKYIMTSGMRNNSIDLETTNAKKIIVCGTELNSNPTAELTWGLILGLYRNFKQEIDNMFQGYWQNTIGTEVKGKRIGLIGLGKIGSQVAKIAKAFDMEVSAWSENLNLSVANKLGVLPMTKDDLLKTSDIVSIHVIAGKRYLNLITKREFSIMKKTAFIINTSRGSIINQNDLVKALEDGQIAGAGLDVYDQEPLQQDHKLRFLPNVLLLPHVGFVTLENYSKFYNQMIENLLSCMDNKPIRVIK